MGYVYAEITLKNANDKINAKLGQIKDEEIRSVTVTATVDTGAMTMIISEELRQDLGLGIDSFLEVELANDQTEMARVTEPVEVHWKDRSYTGSALVLSGWGEPLMGLLPLEFMDLIVDPANQVLIGAHGDKPRYRV